MIKLMVIGHLGKDCTVNTVNGKNVINFSVAHTEKFKDSSGAQREKTTWVECAYWTEHGTSRCILMTAIYTAAEKKKLAGLL